MKIAVIYPSFGVISATNQPNIKAVADNYGIYPNISLSYVAAALQKAGHEVIFLDAMAQGYSIEDMRKIVRKFSPDIMLFTLLTSLFHEILEVISYFRKETDAKVIVGGAQLSLYAKETMKNKLLDIGVIGEAEETIVELVSAIENKKLLQDVKGIAFRRQGKVIITEHRSLINNLDEIPFPARNLLPMNKYFSFISRYKNYTIMITSRGCPFKCKFCEQRTGNIRYRSAQNVVDEIEECYTLYDVREIDFFDPLFTINKKRVMEICKEIRKRNIKIHWSCRSRVDTIDEEMIKAMKDAGCYRIYFGIESGDEAILRRIGKFTTLNQIRNAISLAKNNNVLAFGYFIIGSPGETKQTIEKTIFLSKELNLDYAQFSRMSFLPGTLFYDEIKLSMGNDYWLNYTKEKNNEKQLEMLDCDFSEKELDAFIKRAYKEFYFRPMLIIKLLLGSRSPGEIFRYSKAAIDMIVKG